MGARDEYYSDADREMKAAYVQGEQARKSGAAPSDNPYPKPSVMYGPSLYWQWQAGFRG